ncbi:zinc finger, CCHC-type, retrotransposon gag domain protein [Tanacetum coccineum]
MSMSMMHQWHDTICGSVISPRRSLLERMDASKIAYIEKIFEVLGCADEFKASTFPGLSNKSMRGSTTQFVREIERPVILDGILNTEFTDVAQMANAARNMEILHERSSQNNKWNHDGDGIRLTTQDSNQRGYDHKGYDGHSYDRQGQKRYPDYASSPPCDICGKLHLGKACHRVTGACFTCGSTGHMDRDCAKNGRNDGRGDDKDNQHATKGRVFSSTKDQAANYLGTVSRTLFLNGHDILSYLIRVQHILWFLFHLLQNQNGTRT